MKKLIVVALAALSLIACDKNKDNYTKSENTVSFALTAEPPDLNGMRATDQVSFFILGHTNEGLLRYNEKQEAVGGVAEKWEVNDKGATFYLRKDAKWADGVPVTAKDFVFAWRTVVDPKTASQYAFIMYPVKNAEKINQGKAKVETLGVEAKDDYTLKVTFERPCGYFLKLMTFATYYPVREDFYNAQKGRYAADAANILSNGPFKLVSWVHGASMKLEKNENYWNASVVNLKGIDVPYIITDPKARFELFRDKKIDLVGLTSDTLEPAAKAKFDLRKFSDGSVFYAEFNHRPDRVTRNKKLRQAIRYVYDTKELVEKIVALPGNEPIYTLFPSWLKGASKSFREENPVADIKVDIPRAKKLLEEAKAELQVKEIPTLSLLIGDDPNSKKQGEYIQAILEKHLGIKAMIDIQTFKQRLAKMSSGDFDIVLAGWGPDYDDPMTFADLFTSWNENNRGKYANPAYDKAIADALGTMDAKKRMAAMGRAQKIIIEDVVVLPQYERGIVYIQNPKLKGVIRTVIGADPNFIYSKIQ
jgi:oligopeptide transport system substrate-binding protein